MKTNESKSILWNGKEIYLDEQPDEADSIFFEDYWLVADGHDEDGNQYTIWWVKQKTDDPFEWRIDFEDLEKVEKHIHYEMRGVFAGVSDTWYEEADGYRELAWELEKIDDNGAAYLTEITIDGDMPSDFEETFLWKYNVESSKNENGKIVLTIG